MKKENIKEWKNKKESDSFVITLFIALIIIFIGAIIIYGLTKYQYYKAQEIKNDYSNESRFFMPNESLKYIPITRLIVVCLPSYSTLEESGYSFLTQCAIVESQPDIYDKSLKKYHLCFRFENKSVGDCD